MNPLSREEVAQYLAVLKREMAGKRYAHVIGAVCPPFLYLAEFDGLPEGISKGAQDLFPEKSGAYTGEISPIMLKNDGVGYVIVGHSERRQYGGETDDVIREKALAAIRHHLTPIVCIGETLMERERGETLSVLDRQVKMGFDGVSGEQLADLIIAYEPVWAIGTGKNATPAEAGEAHAHIRGRLRQWFGAAAADGCRILYGGSVKPDNIQDLIALPDVDGALVGGASLDVRSFFEIVSRSRTKK